MRDAYSIIGKEVYYKEKTWTVKYFFYVPNNTNIYVGLTDENGISRWVSKDECVGKFSSLYPTNGNTWYRNSGF